MRLKSAIWVAAYLRRCQTEGIFAALRRKGAEEAGAIFIKVDYLDGRAALYGPAPQSAYDEAQPSDRIFIPMIKDQPASNEAAEEAFARQQRFDSDIWLVEIESRDGRHFLDLAKM